MASTCSDSQSIRIIIALNCTLMITGDPVTPQIEGKGRTKKITIPFDYTMGTGINPLHANYGFDLVEVGVPAGVTISEPVWLPPEPEVDVPLDPAAIKSATVTVSITVPDNYAGGDASFSLDPTLNTGE